MATLLMRELCPGGCNNVGNCYLFPTGAQCVCPFGTEAPDCSSAVTLMVEPTVTVLETESDWTLPILFGKSFVVESSLKCCPLI